MQDLQSLLLQTGAQTVFGLSSGALITLESCRALPSIRKAILYEPPFRLHGIPTREIARFHGQVAQGDLAEALVTALKIVKLAPPWVNLIPRALRVLIANIALKREHPTRLGQYASLRELLPAMRFDFNVVSERGGALSTFHNVETSILLLGGSKSPLYLQDVLTALEQTLPVVRRVEYPGLDHSAAWNVDRGGSPQIVAQTMRTFFADAALGHQELAHQRPPANVRKDSNA